MRPIALTCLSEFIICLEEQQEASCWIRLNRETNHVHQLYHFQALLCGCLAAFTTLGICVFYHVVCVNMICFLLRTSLALKQQSWISPYCVIGLFAVILNTYFTQGCNHSWRCSLGNPIEQRIPSVATQSHISGLFNQTRYSNCVRMNLKRGTSWTKPKHEEAEKQTAPAYYPAHQRTAPESEDRRAVSQHLLPAWVSECLCLCDHWDLAGQ